MPVILQNILRRSSFRFSNTLGLIPVPLFRSIESIGYRLNIIHDLGRSRTAGINTAVLCFNMLK
jgi:hypothetical protein